MSFSDLFSPLRRQFWFFALLCVGLSTLTYGGLSLVPATQKTTIYFSLKPLATENTQPTFDHAESTMKMAEAIAGWAKNPQFREDVAAEAGVAIENLKRKLSARKQNYVNVFWTLKLHDQERAGRDQVVAAILNQINQRFTALNQDSLAPYSMTKAEVFSEDQSLPGWAVILFSILVGFGLGVVAVYLREAWQDRVSFRRDLGQIWPESPVLVVPEKLGTHDEKLLERFILTFDSPRLVGTFPASEKHFSLAPTDAINQHQDTPILLIKLGETTHTELHNLKAILGDKVALIVFCQ